MTRKDAIEAIKCNWPDSRYTILREALDMAVKALEDVADKNVGKMTNAQKIRSMSDEELAEFIATTFENGRISVFAIYPELTENHCGLDWLQQPAGEEGKHESN